MTVGSIRGVPPSQSVSHSAKRRAIIDSADLCAVDREVLGTSSRK